MPKPNQTNRLDYRHEVHLATHQDTHIPHSTFNCLRPLGMIKKSAVRSIPCDLWVGGVLGMVGWKSLIFEQETRRDKIIWAMTICDHTFYKMAAFCARELQAHFHGASSSSPPPSPSPPSSSTTTTTTTERTFNSIT